MKIRFWLLALTALLAACTETRTTWQESTLPIHAFTMDGQYSGINTKSKSTCKHLDRPVRQAETFAKPPDVDAV